MLPDPPAANDNYRDPVGAWIDTFLIAACSALALLFLGVVLRWW